MIEQLLSEKSQTSLCFVLLPTALPSSLHKGLCGYAHANRPKMTDVIGNCQCLARTTAAAAGATDYLNTHGTPTLASSCVVLTAVEDALARCAQCTICSQADNALLQIITLEQAIEILSRLHREITNPGSSSAEPADRSIIIRIGDYVDRIIPAKSLELALVSEHISTLLRLSQALEASFGLHHGTHAFASDADVYVTAIRGLFATAHSRLVLLSPGRGSLHMAIPEPGATRHAATL